MTKFYSATAGGFYDDGINGAMPPDAKQITAAQWQAALDGQAQGGTIQGDANGLPAVVPRPAPTLTDVKAGLMASVDDAVSAVYDRFQRFKAEYDAREAAARAFKAANYVGTPDPWVMSFATPAALSAAQASDLIIAQADGLKAALAVIGALRMRKYAIAAATSASTAQATHDDILAKVQTVSASL